MAKSKPTKGGAKKARSAPKGAKKTRSASKSVASAAKPTKNAATVAKTHTGPPPMFEKIAFSMFQVEDAMRARAFYEDLLGFTRGLASPEGTWTEYDLPGGGCLALFKHPGPGMARSGGTASIAFEVADLDALDEKLKAAGVRYQSDRIHGPNCRMSNILDSEGNAIILHQLNRKN